MTFIFFKFVINSEHISEKDGENEYAFKNEGVGSMEVKKVPLATLIKCRFSKRFCRMKFRISLCGPF